MYRSHGITKEADLFKCPEEAYDAKGNINPWYYEMLDLGFNYRMTEMQAALGVSQLTRLESGIERRREIAEYYRKELKDCEYISFPVIDDARVGHAYHLAIALIDFEKLGKSRAEFMGELVKLDVGTRRR